MLPGTCNCDPFARTKGSFCRNLHEQSSFFDGFSAFHSCSFYTPGYLVPNCRPFPYFFDNRVGYICGIDCTSSWRRLDEWNEGERLDRQKRRVAPLEPGKVIINEFPLSFRPLCEQVILATCCVMSVLVTHICDRLKKKESRWSIFGRARPKKKEGIQRGKLWKER